MSAAETIRDPSADAGPAERAVHSREARLRPIRVLLISHTCQSETEGQPKAERLAEMADIQLKVITPDRWKHYGQWRKADQNQRAVRGNVSAERVRWPWVGPAQFYLHWYPRLKRILLEFRPDVIDLWEEPWALVSAHACRLRNRLLPEARIVSETEQNIDKALPFPFERFRTYTLQNADWVVGRNAEAIEIVRARGYGGPADVVPNAVDAELFRPLDRAQCRKELSVDGFVVGYAGRIVEEKGIADLIDALSLCPDRVNLVLVGSGTAQPQLQARAERLGIRSRVRFLGNRPLEQLPRVMNALDVLVLPSRTTARWKEQFGRVIIEAQACAVPVIGSSSGAIPEVIANAGRVVPERDPAALAAAIKAMMEDSPGPGEMGRIGRRRVEQHYTWLRVAERMADIYRSVIEAPRAATRLRPQTPQ
jgi:glycosyltransferase involved in cell wall biosynthesis